MKLSVVTPCRNSEQTIERTIRSIVCQKTDFELEYIIVDGLSTDRTIEIIEQYSRQYSFIKYISEKDNSMTEALNKGFKMATGDLIASINADDFYLPGAFEGIRKAFESGNTDVLMINTFFINDDYKVKSKSTPRKFSPFICALAECPFPECGIVFKREAISNVGFFDENIRYTQDLELYLRLYAAGYCFSYSNVNASCFYVSGENYSSTIGDKMQREVCTYFKYPRLFMLFSKTVLSKLARVILLLRRYYIFRKPDLSELTEVY